MSRTSWRAPSSTRPAPSTGRAPSVPRGCRHSANTPRPSASSTGSPMSWAAIAAAVCRPACPRRGQRSFRPQCLAGPGGSGGRGAGDVDSVAIRRRTLGAALGGARQRSTRGARRAGEASPQPAGRRQVGASHGFPYRPRDDDAGWRRSSAQVSEDSRLSTRSSPPRDSGRTGRFLSEVRLELDSAVESPKALAPLIDPNVHSCGSVPPHGAEELEASGSLHLSPSA